jgi:hypothetical protein
MKANPELKNYFDTMLRMCLCCAWIVGAILMISEYSAFLADESYPTHAWRACIYAAVTIAAITAHAYLVDVKKKEKNG